MEQIEIAVDLDTAAECSPENVDQMAFVAMKLDEFDCKFDLIVHLVETLFGLMYYRRCVEHKHSVVELILLELKQIVHHKQLRKCKKN